jgi:AcrR family transcriptional regulator
MNRYERQKEASRRQILDSALVTFHELGYYAANVEDIITRAKVSRATFYKHFKSKLAVAEALMREMGDRQAEAYDRLSMVEEADHAAIVAWLNEIIEINEQNKTLLLVIGESFRAEPSLRGAADIADTSRIRKLSKSIPAFRAGLSEGSQARERVQLLLFEIDIVTFQIGARDWGIDHSVAVEFLAGQIENFIAEEAARPRAALVPPTRRRGNQRG